MEFGLRKRWRGLDAFIVTGDIPAWMPADLQMNYSASIVHMCSGFPTRRSKQKIMMSWNDVTRISHAILGGNYKRRAHPNPRAVIWVLWY